MGIKSSSPSIVSNGVTMDFYPEPWIPAIDINPKRVWVHLSDDIDCFENEDDVFLFKDYLVLNYNDCIDFDDEERTEIFKANGAGINNDLVWSLWLDQRIESLDVECLRKPIFIPPQISTECIPNIFFEPVDRLSPVKGPSDDGYDADDSNDNQCIERSVPSYSCTLDNNLIDVECADHKFNLWSLDILDSSDGEYDGKYRYPACKGDDDNSSGSDCADVEVIVLDDGVDTDHREFTDADPKMIVPLKVYDRRHPQLVPVMDHGTHVAATIVGKNVGGAPNTKLRFQPVCKTYNESGRTEEERWICSFSDLEAGWNAVIKYIDGNRRSPTKSDTKYVINYSIGGPRNGVKDANAERIAKTLNAMGAIIVTSAGNDAWDACDYSPAYIPDVVTVGAYGYNLERASYSNYGDCVDVWGPGGDFDTLQPWIWSAKPGGDGSDYQGMHGTSMASPNIASVAVNWYKMTGDREKVLEYLKEYARSDMSYGEKYWLFNGTLNRWIGQTLRDWRYIKGGTKEMKQSYIDCTKFD